MALTLRSAGNRVIYFGQFNNKDEVYSQDHIEEAADRIIWQTKEGEQVTPNRPDDLTFTGDDAITTLTALAQTISLKRRG